MPDLPVRSVYVYSVAAWLLMIAVEVANNRAVVEEQSHW
jgi:hypothetical protein